MAIHGPYPEQGTATANNDQNAGTEGTEQHYTGVIIIHSIGDEQRSATLQEALNALTHWFKHEAKLVTRPQGPGRVWLRTALTEDNNPDQPASCATLELEAPAELVSSHDGESGRLRLEWREVWWAGSFGLPSVRASLKWARVQFTEEAPRIPLLRSTRSGAAHVPAPVHVPAPAPGPDRSRGFGTWGQL